jgi:hypothetical protein
MVGCARSGWASSPARYLVMVVLPLQCFEAVQAAADGATVRELHLSPFTRRYNHSVPVNLSAALSLEYLNHEAYGGLYSQLIYGESFEELSMPVRRESAPPLPLPCVHAHAVWLGWGVRLVQACGDCEQQLCVRTHSPTTATAWVPRASHLTSGLLTATGCTSYTPGATQPPADRQRHKHDAGDKHSMRGFIRREGYLSDESLLEVGWYTAAASAAFCAANSSCCGFTLRGTSRCVWCDSDHEGPSGVRLRTVPRHPSAATELTPTSPLSPGWRACRTAADDSGTAGSGAAGSDEQLAVYFQSACDFVSAAGWVTYSKPAPSYPPAEQGFIGCGGRSNDTRLLANVSSMWLGVLDDDAVGSFALVHHPSQAFHGHQFQRLTFHRGARWTARPVVDAIRQRTSLRPRGHRAAWSRRGSPRICRLERSWGQIYTCVGQPLIGGGWLSLLGGWAAPGTGRVGVSNHGLHCQHGLYLEANRAYAGYTYMRAQRDAGGADGDALEVELTLEDTRTGGALARQTLRVPYGQRWVRLELRLHTHGGSECGGVRRPDAQSGTQWLSQCSGALVMALRSSGTLDVDLTFLSPGAWGLQPGAHACGRSGSSKGDEGSGEGFQADRALQRRCGRPRELKQRYGIHVKGTLSVCLGSRLPCARGSRFR